VRFRSHTIVTHGALRPALAVSIVFLLAGVTRGDDAPGEVPQRTGAWQRSMLRMFARGYFPGRSGQIFLVPREGEVITPLDSLDRFMHGSPWEYDTSIPVLFYGPRYIRAGEHPDHAKQQDVVPTLARLLRLELPPTVTGSVLERALRPEAPIPRVVVLLVLDGTRMDYLTSHGGRMRQLAWYRRSGAWFPSARVDCLPTNTAVGHTTISTGTDPRLHGIVGNWMFDPKLGREHKSYEGCSAHDLEVPTLADLWAAKTQGQAIILAQGSSEPAATALAGHGACAMGSGALPAAGRTVRMACYLYEPMEGRWGTGSDSCYVLPTPLARVVSSTLWAGGATWMRHDLRGGKRVRHSAPFARFEGDAAVATLESEALGADDIPDLVLFNLKAIDLVGHTFGPSSPEIDATLAAVDSQVGRIVETVENKVGPDGYVLAVTADHGMASTSPDHLHRAQDLVDGIHARFDPKGKKLVLPYFPEDSQLHLDPARMKALGVTVADVAHYLETLPYIYAAYTEDEVRQMAAEMWP
jgi:type I phosphodiesterase/nucleotide pyrophosphatase